MICSYFITFRNKLQSFFAALLIFVGSAPSQVDKIRLDPFARICYNRRAGGDAPVEQGTKTIATNQKAYHEYFVLEQLEAGISLCGTEVKSIRKGGVNLRDAWCAIEDGELYVKQMHISPYEQGNIFNRDPLRERKLLLHKREILRLFGTIQEQGLTLIPLALYFKGSRVKVRLGLCRGKKLYDKRAVAAEKSANREIERALKERNRSG